MFEKTIKSLLVAECLEHLTGVWKVVGLSLTGNSEFCSSSYAYDKLNRVDLQLAIYLGY